MSKVLYLCDRRKCEACKPYCTHTSDIEHAVNFERVHGLVYEKVKEERECVLDYKKLGNYEIPIIPKLQPGKCLVKNEQSTN